VHKSFVEFAVEDDAIRFGLLAVKNVGENAIQSIIDARQATATSPPLRTSVSRRPAAGQQARHGMPGQGRRDEPIRTCCAAA